MSRLNEMRIPTWNSLGLNYKEYDSTLLTKKDYFKKSNDEVIKELNDAFEGKIYGLSEDINRENRKFRNYSIYRDIDGIKETEFINLELNKDNNILVSGIDINAKENSESSFLVSIFDDASDKFFINSSIRVNLQKDSKVKLVVVTNLSNDSTNLNSIAAILEENAMLDLSYIEIGASYSLVNIKNMLIGDCSKLIENGVYFKSGDDFLDILATNEHLGDKTDSNSMFNGALKGSAHKNRKGVVDLKKGCHCADGKIVDYSMMLSDEVINKSAPILLNEEKEVRGKHAASVGRLNKDMLFYIMSRGLSKKHAEAMMLEANFAPTLDKIEDESLRNSLKEKVHQMNTRI